MLVKDVDATRYKDAADVLLMLSPGTDVSCRDDSTFGWNQ